MGRLLPTSIRKPVVRIQLGELMHRVGGAAVTRILSACFFTVFAVFAQPLSAQSKDQPTPKENIEVGAPEPARPSANAIAVSTYAFTSSTGVALEDMSSG